jgi:hypothetical protein
MASFDIADAPGFRTINPRFRTSQSVAYFSAASKLLPSRPLVVESFTRESPQVPNDPSRHSSPLAHFRLHWLAAQETFAVATMTRIKHAAARSMAKQPSKPRGHAWAVYHIKGTPV